MRLWTASRPLSNGARASTRTYPIIAHRKCHRSHPSRVAWHIPPLLPNEKEARGSHKKARGTPDGPLAEAKGLSLQLCRDPATQARTRGASTKQTPPSERNGCVRAMQEDRETPGSPLAPSRGLGVLSTTKPRLNNPNSHSWARLAQ